ncbi:MAG: hypothetical protein WKG00_01645 [Polyangiaceae bacterium]
MDTRAAAHETRSARLFDHCRQAVQLAAVDAEYRDVVLERLRHDGGPSAEDLWSAIPWVWRLVLAPRSPVTGALHRQVEAAACVLREGLSMDTSPAMLDARWNTATQGTLALGSTLRSHPFADLRSWSIRKQFRG